MSVLMGNTIDNNGTFSQPGARVGHSGGPQTLASRPDGQKPPGQSGERAGDSQTHVRFSDSVAMLQRLQSRLDAHPVVDSSRVETARSAIGDGSYQINHDTIASKLIAAERELP